MSAKSNKIELSEQCIVMWKEEQPPRVFCKKVFLEISQNSQENVCARVSFLNKVAGLTNFLRASFLTEHLRVTAYKVWKECRINFSFFHTDISNKVLFEMRNLFSAYPRDSDYVFELAWHWLADTQRLYSCLYNILSSYRCLMKLQWDSVSTELEVFLKSCS